MTYLQENAYLTHNRVSRFFAAIHLPGVLARLHFNATLWCAFIAKRTIETLPFLAILAALFYGTYKTASVFRLIDQEELTEARPAHLGVYFYGFAFLTLAFLLLFLVPDALALHIAFLLALVALPLLFNAVRTFQKGV